MTAYVRIAGLIVSAALLAVGNTSATTRMPPVSPLPECIGDIGISWSDDGNSDTRSEKVQELLQATDLWAGKRMLHILSREFDPQENKIAVHAVGRCGSLYNQFMELSLRYRVILGSLGEAELVGTEDVTR